MLHSLRSHKPQYVASAEMKIKSYFSNLPKDFLNNCKTVLLKLACSNQFNSPRSPIATDPKIHLPKDTLPAAPDLKNPNIEPDEEISAAADSLVSQTENATVDELIDLRARLLLMYVKSGEKKRGRVLEVIYYN